MSLVNVPRDLVAPFVAGLAVAGALALLIWGAYEVAMWFGELLARALLAILVIGYGLDPVIVGPASTPFPAV